MTLRHVGGRRVFHVGQPHLGAGVERVDGHLPVNRPGDLHSPVLQARRRGSDAPVRIVADVRRLREEPRILSARDLAAAGVPRLHQLLAALRRRAVQGCHELEGIRGKNLVLPVNGLGGQRDAVDRVIVGETVHFNLSSEKQMFDGGSSSGARRGVAAACVKGPCARSVRVHEVVRWAWGIAGRALPVRRPEVTAAVGVC